MEKELNNTVNAVGNYNSIPTSVTSAASVVTMIDGLTITKVADKPVWADGELTYTITISNNADKPYVSPKIKDRNSLFEHNHKPKPPVQRIYFMGSTGPTAT